jgi:hypothetical protein
LVGPIALYPDPLVALILPASTVPSDITLADRYLDANGDPAGIGAQSWDPSVKGLAHYPQVLKWMDDNLSWTQALGAAFAQQPADVMKSIQQLRAQAQAAGTLVNTPEQRIEMEGDEIRIVPADAGVIYVPQYDPDLVYQESEAYSGPFVTFGAGFPVGAWLGYECDWDDFGIWIGPWYPGWTYRRDWRGGGGAPWRLDPRRSWEVMRNGYRPAGNLPRPDLIGGGAGPARRPAGAHRPAMEPPSSRPDYRGWRGQAAPRSAAPAPSPLLGGYGRGTQAREYSTRGQASREAPVSNPARSAPARESAPSSGSRDRH